MTSLYCYQSCENNVSVDFSLRDMRRRGYDAGRRVRAEYVGVPKPDEHLVKAELVFKIDAILKERRLKQVEAGKLFGIPQPDVSKMLRGDFRQFSVGRLLRFLVALDQDVEIRVRSRCNARHGPTLHVS